MRITGGHLGGRKLAAPGDNRVRPTSDKVRQAIFNILRHQDYGFVLEGARTADLFAGTGALGIEAISQGARHSASSSKTPPKVARSSSAISKIWD